MLHVMWDLLGPGNQPVAPAVEGGFFTAREVPCVLILVLLPVVLGRRHHSRGPGEVRG